MSVECRRKKSVERRCKMSLLTGSRARFRADHHERSEVGDAEAEGLVNDTGTDPARVYVKDVAAELGVHPRTVSRALKRGGSPPGQRPAARKSKLDRYKPVIDRLLAAGVWNAAVILRETPGAGIQRAGEHPARLHPAQAAAAPGPGDGALRDRAGRAVAKRLG
jgi:hypothetical protein